MKKLTVSLLLLTLISFAGQIFALDKAAAIADQLTRLAKAPSAKDSVIVLYNIFDLSPRKDQPDVARQIYAAASRAGMRDVQLDIARQATTFFDKPEVCDTIIAAVNLLPDSREKTETILFIRMMKLAQTQEFSSESHRQAQLVDLIANLENERNDDMQLYDLYAVVEYLGSDVKGEMLATYLGDLVKLVNSDSFSLYALRNLVYTEAANTYTDVGDYKKAIEADRYLLSVMHDLQEDYHDSGRLYRDFSIAEYISLRRMMRNYKALNLQEIEQIHARALELAGKYPEVADDMSDNPRYYAHYYTATEQYDKALPYIRRQLLTERSASARRQLLGMQIEAARHTGNQALLLSGLTEYNEMLEELNHSQATNKYKELQILYDINNLKRKNLNLELERQKAESERARMMMYWVLGAWIVCLIGLAVIFIIWRRYRRNVAQLNMLADHVAEERDRLKRLAYYDYAEDDLPDDNEFMEVRPASSRSNHSDNALQVIENILNDLMYIASIGKEAREKQIMAFKLSSLIDSCAEKVRPLLAPGVKLDIQRPEENITIHADRDCAEHVLFHMLRDSAKYTDKGEILLQISPTPEMGMVRFTVTDTGLPLEAGVEEIMFENFLDINKLIELPSSGIFLSRMSAFLLSSSLKSARKYKNGCKFTFLMPIDEN